MGIESAIADWKRALGASRVVVGSVHREKAAQATYASTYRVAAILQPRTRADVVESVRISRRHGVPIYPISRGRNLGYGSSVPTQDQSVILDLSSMSGIELDRQLGTVTIEPGVTSLQVAQYVAKHAPEFAACVPLHMPSGSALGNAMDGGVGVGPYADRFAHVCSLEVVLGTGEMIRTGMDRAEHGTRLGRTETRVGPSLRDLFMQSNFGVVTRMTLGLFPLPRDLRMVTVKIENDARVSAFIEKMRPLILGDVLTRSFQINNEYIQLMRALEWQYPWSLAGDRTPLPRELLHQFRKMLGNELPGWEAFILLSSKTTALGRAREQAIRQSLQGFDVKSKDLSRSRRSYFIPQPAERSAFRWLYWRKRDRLKNANDLDPHRDRCGFMWCDFVMPMDPKLFVEVVPELRQLVRSYGFEPAIEVHTFWPRALFLIVALSYDRNLPDADVKALKCDREMTRFLAPLGILPSRRRVGSMDLLAPSIDDSAEVFGRVKEALDPARVISPGRYETTRRPSQSKLGTASTVVDAVEQVHLDLFRRSHRIPGSKLAKGLRPLRPLLLERAKYDQAQTAARAILSVLIVAGKELAASERWRRLLSVEQDTAAVLSREIDVGPVIGKLEGAFDDQGTYRIFGFDSHVEKIEDLASLPSGLSSRFWKPPAAAGELRRIEELSGLTGRNARKPADLTSKSRRKTTVAADRLLGNLAALTLLSDPALRPRISPKAIEHVERHLPWSRFCRPGRTTYRGKSYDLATLLKGGQRDFVLRSTFRDSPIVVGANVSASEWKRSIREAFRSPGKTVAQERVPIAQDVFPLSVRGTLEFEGCFVGMDVAILLGSAARTMIARIAEDAMVGAHCLGTRQVPILVAAK